MKRVPLFNLKKILCFRISACLLSLLMVPSCNRSSERKILEGSDSDGSLSDLAAARAMNDTWLLVLSGLDAAETQSILAPAAPNAEGYSNASVVTTLTWGETYDGMLEVGY